MNSLDVVTILLSIVGVVAVTEIAMWLFVVIFRAEHFRFNFQPLVAHDSSSPDHHPKDQNHPTRIINRF